VETITASQLRNALINNNGVVDYQVSISDNLVIFNPNHSVTMEVAGSVPLSHLSAEHPGSTVPVAKYGQAMSSRKAIRLAVSPSPATRVVDIAYDIPADQAGGPSVEIFDLRGKRVFSFNSRSMLSNTGKITWNTTDYSGQSVSAGLYMVRLNTDSAVLSRRIFLMK
jgi:hypothetical protein